MALRLILALALLVPVWLAAATGVAPQRPPEHHAGLHASHAGMGHEHASMPDGAHHPAYGDHTSAPCLVKCLTVAAGLPLPPVPVAVPASHGVRLRPPSMRLQPQSALFRLERPPRAS